jgi:hypothetical protein
MPWLELRIRDSAIGTRRMVVRASHSSPTLTLVAPGAVEKQDLAGVCVAQELG